MKKLRKVLKYLSDLEQEKINAMVYCGGFK